MFELHTWATECLVFPFDELKLESQVCFRLSGPQRGYQWGSMLGWAEKRVRSTGIAAEVVVGILVL